MAKASDSLKLSAETGLLLEQTLAAAVKDRQTVTSEGKSLDGLIEGSVFREVPTHVDERGSVVELFDPRWQWHPDPLVFAYSFTIKPGFAKGWNLHKLHRTDISFYRARWNSSSMT